MNASAGDWVVVEYLQSLYPGQVIEKNATSYKVCNHIWHPANKVIKKISPPKEQQMTLKTRAGSFIFVSLSL